MSPPGVSLRFRAKSHDNKRMSRTARPIVIEANLLPEGNDRDLARWVEATRIIMKLHERETEETVGRYHQFSFGQGFKVFLAVAE